MPSFARITINIALLVVCMLGVALSARSGLSRSFAETALASNDVDSANEAVRLSPSDPEALYVRGLVLTNAGESQAAIESLDSSIRLRPNDYRAWQQLGRVSEQIGDVDNALKAFTETTRLAPYYAEPHLSLGRLLLKNSRTEEGFAELRLASESDPSLLPDVIDLAWDSYKGDAENVQRVIQPQTDATRILLSLFFIRHHEMKTALELLRESGSAANHARREITIQLIEEHRFSDAAAVSQVEATADPDSLLHDGDFEIRGIWDTAGFHWQSARSTNGMRIAIDDHNAHSGSRSLSITFNGATDTDAELAKNLFLVEPRTRYELTFASRVEELVSSALPIVKVVDASPAGPLLATSQPVVSGTSGWQTQTIEFTTTDHIEAAYISIQRQKCPEASCPILGRVWFDGFKVKKIDGPNH